MSTATLAAKDAWAEVTRAGVVAGEALGLRIEAAQRHRMAATSGMVPDERIAQLGAELEQAAEHYREADQAYRAARAVAMQLDQPAPRVSPPRTKRPTPAACRPVVQPLNSLQTALAVGDVVSKDYHAAAVQTAVERVERRWAGTADRLRELLRLAQADRVAAVYNALAEVAPNRAGKHSDTCWQRHAACLANHLRALLEGGDQ